ncbi:MAG: GtrA family protein [Candidatus Symbiothrix sp.]|jgi:putative flippase GtrA|nr:GtrA family protein [Candidatus Symbiothrix sp.]
MKNNFLIQTIKYGIVGIMNTLLTMITIWVMMRIVFRPEEGEKISSLVLSVSNTVGYIVGLINSFIWNRLWTFKSKNKWKPEFIRFTIAFLICFVIQLVLVNILYKYVIISGFHLSFFRFEYTVSTAEICQLAGIIIYTAMNFILNKYFTFKNTKSVL